MTVTEHMLSLTDFQQQATETLDRLKQTGDAEILTVDGEARAVLLSPAAYDTLAREADLNREAADMRRAIRQLDDGEGQEVNAFFGELHAKLLAMKAAQANGAAK